MVLLGSVQHPTYAHPKLLGQCFNNVYHQGWLIGNLPASGKLPTEDHTQKIYDQEYEEVVDWVEKSLNLSTQALGYLPVPTSLLNPEIVLHPKEYRKVLGLPDMPPGQVPPSWDYGFDGARGLVDLAWTQRIQQIQQDDINRNLLYNQYPHQEGDNYEDEGGDGSGQLGARKYCRCPHGCLNGPLTPLSPA